VKRQVDILAAEFSAEEEFLEQLEAEHRIKPEVREGRSMGFLQYDETYLWYGEVPTTLKAADYATPVAWFNVLKTPATTPRAAPRTASTSPTTPRCTASCRRAACRPATAWSSRSCAARRRATSASPSSSRARRGHGRLAARREDARGRRRRRRQRAPVNDNASSTAPSRRGPSANRTPSAARRHAGDRHADGGNVTSTPVQNVKVHTATGNVGYLLFNDHITTSEALLMRGEQFKGRNGIQDLVLDMRYNGGGQLAIASRLAYMVSSPPATARATFERWSSTTRTRSA
jgi:carboxyl-terminal processing protease